MGLLTPLPTTTPPGFRRRLVFAAAALGLTMLLAWLALWLGAWAFQTRSMRLHEERLQRLLEKSPRLEQVVGGIQAEGGVLLASPGGADELRAIAGRAGGQASAVLDMGARWPVVRVFQVGDAVYFLFFDTAGVMRGFVLATRSPRAVTFSSPAPGILRAAGGAPWTTAG